MNIALLNGPFNKTLTSTSVFPLYLNESELPSVFEPVEKASYRVFMLALPRSG